MALGTVLHSVQIAHSRQMRLFPPLTRLPPAEGLRPTMQERASVVQNNKVSHSLMLRTQLSLCHSVSPCDTKKGQYQCPTINPTLNLSPNETHKLCNCAVSEHLQKTNFLSLTTQVNSVVCD